MDDDDFGSRPGEYVCCECERRIVRMTGEVPDPKLCGHCLFIPGWHEDPKLVAIFEPESAEAFGRRKP